MSVVVVDTSSWIEYFKSGRNEAQIEDALSEGRVAVPSLVVAELLSGRMTPSKRKSLTSFLSELSIEGTSFDHWCRVGDLRSKLAQNGISISTPDCHIAQVSIELGAQLLTEDKIFPVIKNKIGLKIL